MIPSSIPTFRPRIHRIIQAVRGPDSAKYRYSQPPKERGIRCNQGRTQRSVVPSGRNCGHEIHADRKQPPHEEARCH